VPKPPRQDRRPHFARQGLTVPAFQEHAGQMKKAFYEPSPGEVRILEGALKKVGKRAAALMEQT